MRHWNSPNLNPLTNKNNEKSEIKTGANSFLIQYALYIKHICFRLQLTLILVVLLFSLRVVSSVVFNHFYWRVTETGGTCIDIPSDSHGHSCNVTHERKSAARPIALVHVQSSDYLVIRAILLHYHTALAFIVHQSHINERFIARFTAFTSQNGALNRASFVWVLFHLQIPCEQFTTHIWYFRSHEYFVALLVRQLWKGQKTLLNLIFRYFCVKNKTFHFNLLWYF